MFDLSQLPFDALLRFGPWLILFGIGPLVVMYGGRQARNWKNRRLRKLLSYRPMMYGMEPIRQPLTAPPALRARIAQALALRHAQPHQPPTPTISGPVAWAHGLHEGEPNREDWEREHD